MKRIELEVTLETKDYWRYYLSLFFSAGNLFYFYLGFTVFGYCVAFLLSDGDLPIQMFLEIAADAALFLVLFNLAMVYFSVANAEKVNNQNCKYIFTEDNVEVVAKFFKSQTNWNYITGVKETANCFFLPMKSGDKHFIPKRFFRDDEQMTDFKNLLREKLGEKALLKKSKENLGLK